MRPENQGGYPVEPVRYGHTGRGSPPLAQAEIQTKPNPPPPPALKVVREWEGVGVWPIATAPVCLLLAACPLLAQPVRSILDTKEGYKTKTPPAR